jgi:uncharacterized MnhB-related membrane protein
MAMFVICAFTSIGQGDIYGSVIAKTLRFGGSS